MTADKMTLDSLIDTFVTRFTPKAIAKLPPWLRRIANQIVEAFKEIDFDELLKKLVDEWLSGDQSEPLVGYVMKRYPHDRTMSRVPGGRTVAMQLEPLTFLMQLQLAIRINGFFSAKAPEGAMAAEGDEASVNAAAIEAALASDASGALPVAQSSASSDAGSESTGRKRRGG